MNSATLAIGIPFSGRYVPPEWAMQLATLSVPMNTNYSYFTVKGMKRDAARDYLAQKALAAHSKYLLMLDDDTAPPAFAIHELMYAMDQADDDVAVMAGVYCTKTNPPVPIVSKDIGDGPFWKWKTGEIFEAPYLGTGCMMIRVSVFDKLPKPWFKDINTVAEAKQFGMPLEADSAEQMTYNYRVTDDIYFCRQLALAKYKCMAHGGVLPIHFDQSGNAYMLPDDSYPVKNGSIRGDALYNGFGFRPSSLAKPEEPTATDLQVA